MIEARYVFSFSPTWLGMNCKNMSSVLSLDFIFFYFKLIKQVDFCSFGSIDQFLLDVCETEGNVDVIIEGCSVYSFWNKTLLNDLSCL